MPVIENNYIMCPTVCRNFTRRFPCRRFFVKADGNRWFCQKPMIGTARTFLTNLFIAIILSTLPKSVFTRQNQF